MIYENSLAFPKDLYVVVKVTTVHGESTPTYGGEPFFLGKQYLDEIGSNRTVAHYQLVEIGKTEVKFEKE